MSILKLMRDRQMYKYGHGVEKFDMQGGVKNYLGEQETVSDVPVKWQSAPDHPTTELAYITEAEKDLLLNQDLHGSLDGGVNRGPSGIMSLNGWGSYDSNDTSVDTGMSGTATSDAEAGRNTANTRAESPTPSGPALAPGVTSNIDPALQGYRDAFIAAGGGQRVNPGFFDSRNTVSPAELAAAKAYAPQAYGKTRGGIGNFISGGGILGAGIRGVGNMFGLGKTYDQPTYDMSNDINYNYDGDFNDGVEDIFEDDVTTETVVDNGGNNGGDGGHGGGRDKGVMALIEKVVNEDNYNPEFKQRYLQNRTDEERAAIKKMIEDKFKWNNYGFGLGDMDGS